MKHEKEIAAKSGRRRLANSRPTRIKIMEAAERLFAMRGIDAVSLREIAAEAGRGNHNAVQYHFGSKENLIFELLNYRTELLEPVRVEMLKRAEAAGKLLDVRTLLEIVCLPYLGLRDHNGAHTYAAFVAQFLTHSYTDLVAHPYDDANALPISRRARQLIMARLAHLPAPVLRLRLNIAMLMFFNMLSRQDAERQHKKENMKLADAIRDIFDQMTAAISRDHIDDRPPLFADLISASETP